MEDEREEEITSLSSIFPEIEIDSCNPHKLSLLVPVAPSEVVSIRTSSAVDSLDALTLKSDSVGISHLPPLRLSATLPEGYPDNAFPLISLESKPAWLDYGKLKELENECMKLWEEYGHCQILFTYIDYIQQAAERFFDLEHSITVKPYLKDELVEFSKARDKEIFENGSFDCGVCLEPKKGTSCHRMTDCGHVFCRACLQDFYNSAITEGDVGNVACLEPSCGKTKPGEPPKKRKAIHPRELLEIGILESQARRYVELKRKKKLESDKSTIYCPRSWCQAPARSNRYPPIPSNLLDYIDESADEASDPPPAYTKDTPESKLPSASDRLAICSNPSCQLAFCRVCYLGWHGEFARCWPRNPADLSEEEKASYDYIRLHTSPCPTCSSPVQKTMGCNHMKCFQCNTHFCYLCGAWLLPDNPYQHFNQRGNDCYMKLWELEEGDEGQAGAFEGARRWEREAMEVARRAQEEEDGRAANQLQQDDGIQHPVMGEEQDVLEVDIVQDEPRREREREWQRERHRMFFAEAGPPPGPIDPMHAMVLRAEQLRVQEPGPDGPEMEHGEGEGFVGGRRRGRGRYERDNFDEGRGRGQGRGDGRGGRARGGVRGGNAVAQNGRGNGRAERGRGRGRGGGVQAGRDVVDGNGQLDAREAAALRRFVEMARNDEEDEWDSDELEDDGMFEIR
ncbi:E3 ubiquitin-protein ligase dbl4 [Sphaceloma murrayae]|uniref:RBR-type E3 ubiquitin transferase n=1 Tax=Sphaceloma murrayae TaxID=2082308 RepID=A0A2K1QH07_9PEZI|nr:E3 ubiquitin-protein ligase dbl4 [Sphaceloma murrayae]